MQSAVGRRAGLRERSARPRRRGRSGRAGAADRFTETHGHRAVGGDRGPRHDLRARGPQQLHAHRHDESGVLGDRRGTRRVATMPRPGRFQRASASKPVTAPVVRRHDRLVVEAQLVFARAPRRNAISVSSRFGDGGAQVLVEQLGAVPAAFLGAVRGDVGVLEQRVGVRLHRRRRRRRGSPRRTSRCPGPRTARRAPCVRAPRPRALRPRPRRRGTR